jgi:predicted GNAT family acetyltransferase
MSQKSSPQNVSRSRFEFEEAGEIAYLEFDVDGQGWITLWHTEVPPRLRGRGIAGILARTAFEYARNNHLKVDVICPVAKGFLEKHPEFKDLVGK